MRIDLAQIDVCPHVVGINLKNALKRNHCFFRPTLHFRNQTEDVVWLRSIGRERGRVLSFPLGSRQIGHIEKRDAEIDVREVELRIDLQRASEGVSSLFVFELLEQRHADVVGAICILARGRGRPNLWLSHSQ